MVAILGIVEMAIVFIIVVVSIKIHRKVKDIKNATDKKGEKHD